MVLYGLGHGIAEIEAVFHKCRRCSCALRWAKSNPVDTVIAFDLNSRNAEIDVLTGRDLVEIKASEVDTEFIQQGGRESAYERE